ncbi:hypothetical protein SVAN01_04893 [Stagonosporopsis vannaccii]|nr:hypothetical protein SVAN01_04893 [Stagonosporopsis vannaccii]
MFTTSFIDTSTSNNTDTTTMSTKLDPKQAVTFAA